MIIFRYLAREVFGTFAVISVILLLIVMSNQFARYLTMTAAGKLMWMQLLHLLALEIPQLLSLIFPLAFYLSVLLSYGRLYVDSEMVIFTACGLSQRRLLGMTLLLSAAVVIPVMLFTLWLNPIVANTRNELLAQIRTTSMLQALLPGRFQQTADGKQIFYVESMSSDHQQLKNVFVAEQVQSNNPTVSDTWNVMSAAAGHHFVDAATKDHFVVADDGYRYEGVPGSKNFTIYHFDHYGVRINTPTPYLEDNIDSVPTWRLIQQAYAHKLEAAAELQWRFSLPLCTLVLALLAFSLSRVAPRQGRFAKLFPAILFYIIYANFIIVGQNWISEGELAPWLGLWSFHVVMATIGLMLYARQSGLWRVWQKSWSRR
jgi:lipopolysaccharide export system permease protein